MKLSKWFDPNNIEHIKAYYYLYSNGQWPEKFINYMKENNVFIDQYWDSLIKTKIVDAWINYKLKRGNCEKNN